MLALALGGSAVMGIAAGALVAACACVEGVRPRPVVRERKQRVVAVCSCIGMFSLLATVVGVVSGAPNAVLLVMTCVVTAVLLGFAAWLVLVEPDDRGDASVPVGPDWWPSFERDLEEWTRRNRRPIGSRS